MNASYETVTKSVRAKHILQFYAQAIVLDDYTAITGIKRSYGVVRSNLIATAGYTILVMTVSGVVGLVIGGLSLVTNPEAAQLLGLPELSTATIIGVWLAVTLLIAVVSAFFLIYSVAFYRFVSN